MSLHDWITNTHSRLREEGMTGVTESVYALYRGSWRIVGSRLPLGANIFDHDWDVLVILDACRVDLLANVAADADYIEDVETSVSVGSTSREWLAKTFSPAYREIVRETAYVTANPYTEEIFSSEGGDTRSPFNPANWPTVAPNDFLVLEEVWKDGWDDDRGTVLPRDVTDRAIAVGRTHGPPRMIIHYMQPHQPFLSENGKLLFPEFVGDYWGALRRGDLPFTDIWGAYEQTLRLVLDDVELLRENMDAQTVILTADHGNAFGEWGIMGHPNGCLHPSVKTVPWAETTARDRGTYEPTVDRSEPTSSIEDQLQNLGYVT